MPTALRPARDRLGPGGTGRRWDWRHTDRQLGHRSRFRFLSTASRRVRWRPGPARFQSSCGPTRNPYPPGCGADAGSVVVTSVRTSRLTQTPMAAISYGTTEDPTEVS